MREVWIAYVSQRRHFAFDSEDCKCVNNSRVRQDLKINNMTAGIIYVNFATASSLFSFFLFCTV